MYLILSEAYQNKFVNPNKWQKLFSARRHTSYLFAQYKGTNHLLFDGRFQEKKPVSSFGRSPLNKTFYWWNYSVKKLVHEYGSIKAPNVKVNAKPPLLSWWRSAFNKVNNCGPYESKYFFSGNSWLVLFSFDGRCIFWHNYLFQ